MEDQHICEPELAWLPDCGFFGVFDGHGGAATSTYIKDNLVSSLKQKLDQQSLLGTPSEDFIQCFRDSIIAFDKEIREASIAMSGSTAICGFVTPTHFIIANLGDSRCVLSRDGHANPLSVDHKPALETEKKRIYDAGGYVLNNRVNGDLAVSRSFGDFIYKQNNSLSAVAQPVSCEPDIRVIAREPTDNYLIFACDGIWDVFSPDDLIRVLNDLLESYETPEEAVCQLLDLCLERGSKDNMTFMLILLDNAPKPNEEKIKLRKENEEKLAAAQQQQQQQETPKEL